MLSKTTHRRSDRARKTWETHFTTGTSRTRRTRVTNRPKFTLKMAAIGWRISSYLFYQQFLREFCQNSNCLAYLAYHNVRG